MIDFLPVNSSSLRTDTTVGCDLYLLVLNLKADMYCIAEERSFLITIKEKNC
jgi:hypothetical protein